MPRHVRPDLPRWLSSRSVAWTGLLLALLVLGVGGMFVLYTQRAAQQRELQSAELYARVLQDHAERTFDTIDIALASLDDNIAARLQGPGPSRLGRDLMQAQQGMPFLRSLSVMDATGRVWDSSVSGNVGMTVDLARIQTPARGTADRLGALVQGRDLSDTAAPPVRNASHSFIPLVRTVASTGGEPLFLVATVNPDFFANAFELTLADPTRSAALVSIDAALLTATGGIDLAPGRSLASHPFFETYLPLRESGSLVAPGIDGVKVVTAFRLLRKRPIAVIVERRYEHLQAELKATARWVAAACGLVLAVMGALGVMAWRSLRSHEAVNATLRMTRDHVAASERDLRSLVQSVHEWIFRADAQGRITFVNRCWQQVSGRPDTAALGRRLADLCLQSERASVDALFRVGRPDHSEAVTARIVHAEGDTRTLEISVAAVVEGDGSLTGFAGFAVDVSERERARERLESQLAFTARLLDVSPTPLFVKDVNGDFIMVNQAWLDLMGLELAQVVGRSSTDLFGAEAPFHHEQDQRLLRSEARLSYENRLMRPGREGRDTVVTKVRFTQADGTPAGIVGSIVDVTAFRAAERRTREARDAAELASRAKSEFLANISHELRTPLQAIIGFSDLGVDLACDVPELVEMFGDIRAGGDRMLTLVNALLDVAQIDGVVGSMTLQHHDLSGLIEGVVETLRPKAAARGQRIAVRGTMQARADVDGPRFQQALRQVLLNACRFAPAGSGIEVACVDRGAAGVEVTVRDHGPGIPEAELETVFEAFVQSSRTSDGSGGTGLGLTIARKIMSAHGGGISASNAPGGGAVLRLWLPAGVGLHDEPALLTSEAR